MQSCILQIWWINWKLFRRVITVGRTDSRGVCQEGERDGYKPSRGRSFKASRGRKDARDKANCTSQLWYRPPKNMIWDFVLLFIKKILTRRFRTRVCSERPIFTC
ncbi:hypothetical protein MKX03_017296, partial [Papaver bracteatum]